MCASDCELLGTESTRKFIPKLDFTPFAGHFSGGPAAAGKPGNRVSLRGPFQRPREAGAAGAGAGDSSAISPPRKPFPAPLPPSPSRRRQVSCAGSRLASAPPRSAGTDRQAQEKTNIQLPTRPRRSPGDADRHSHRPFLPPRRGAAEVSRAHASGRRGRDQPPPRCLHCSPRPRPTPAAAHGYSARAWVSAAPGAGDRGPGHIPRPGPQPRTARPPPHLPTARRASSDKSQVPAARLRPRGGRGPLPQSGPLRPLAPRLPPPPTPNRRAKK